MSDDGDEHTTQSSLDGDDLASLSSLGSALTNEQKKQKLKRAIAQVTRLKAEVAMLRDALETARLNDVTLIEDRYRGSQTDLANVRKRNIELKDRVQVLEKSLFDALAENRELKSGGKEGFVDTEEDEGSKKGRTKKFSNLDSYGDDQTMKINALRRSHDIKTSEYVTKIAALQGRVDQLEAEKAMTDDSTHNFGISNVANRLSASNSLDDEVLRSLSVKLPRLDRQKLEGYIAELVDEKCKADRKTINGLIQEVDRLTALVPEPESESESESEPEPVAEGEQEVEQEAFAHRKRVQTSNLQPEYNFMHIFLGFFFWNFCSFGVVVHQSSCGCGDYRSRAGFH